MGIAFPASFCRYCFFCPETIQSKSALYKIFKFNSGGKVDSFIDDFINNLTQIITEKVIKYLCDNLKYDIPLQFIYTENDPDIPFSYVENLINNRNKFNNVNRASR